MNYTTYYNRGQRVFLINLSPDRDESVFEAFSATIMACDNTRFELRPRYNLRQGSKELPTKGMLFKVTAESFGAGVQFSGEVDTVSHNGFTLMPTGPIEMYQRSQVSRMDTTVGFRSFTRNAPLEVFRQEWQHLQEGLLAGKATDLEMVPSQINLGIGGLRFMAAPDDRQYDLAMVFIQLGCDRPPICAVAEQLWHRTLPDMEGTVVGRRFVIIRKEDQLLIQRYLEQRLKKQGRRPPKPKNNWELLDRMFYSTKSC